MDIPFYRVKRIASVDPDLFPPSCDGMYHVDVKVDGVAVSVNSGTDRCAVVSRSGMVISRLLLANTMMESIRTPQETIIRGEIYIDGAGSNAAALATAAIMEGHYADRARFIAYDRFTDGRCDNLYGLPTVYRSTFTDKKEAARYALDLFATPKTMPCDGVIIRGSYDVPAVSGGYAQWMVKYKG